MTENDHNCHAVLKMQTYSQDFCMEYDTLKRTLIDDHAEAVMSGSINIDIYTFVQMKIHAMRVEQELNMKN